MDAVASPILYAAISSRKAITYFVDGQSRSLRKTHPKRAFKFTNLRRTVKLGAASDIFHAVSSNPPGTRMEKKMEVGNMMVRG
jgi:hypothetical protein